MNALSARSILGDTTHVSTTIKSTRCTTALKKFPYTRFVSPSLMSTPCSIPRSWYQTGIYWEKAKARGVETESESESGTDTEGGEARYIEIRASGSSGEEWSGASADKWEVRKTR